MTRRYSPVSHSAAGSRLEHENRRFCSNGVARWHERSQLKLGVAFGERSASAAFTCSTVDVRFSNLQHPLLRARAARLGPKSAHRI